MKIKKIAKSKGFIAFVIIIAILIIRHIICINTAFSLPDYPKKDISYIENGSIGEDKYEELFMQTGLSPVAIGEFLQSGDAKSIYALQKGIFTKPDIEKNYIAFPVTSEERISNPPTKMAKLRDGDILVTFNTNTLDWRHGHLGLVIDAELGVILEHMAIGETSCLSSASSWGRYPAFAVLRYEDEELSKKAAEYAKESLVDIGYSIFAGLIKKDKSDMETVDSSHCSHIVWQAYKAVGIDLDSDKGAIVTPRDVAMSESLHAVQIYGLSYKDYIDRMSRNE